MTSRSSSSSIFVDVVSFCDDNAFSLSSSSSSSSSSEKSSSISPGSCAAEVSLSERQKKEVRSSEMKSLTASGFLKICGLNTPFQRQENVCVCVCVQAAPSSLNRLTKGVLNDSQGGHLRCACSHIVRAHHVKYTTQAHCVTQCVMQVRSNQRGSIPGE